MTTWASPPAVTFRNTVARLEQAGSHREPALRGLAAIYGWQPLSSGLAPGTRADVKVSS